MSPSPHSLSMTRATSLGVVDVSGFGPRSTEIVRVDRSKNDDAQNHVLPLLRHRNYLQTVSQDGHDEGTDHGSEYCALAAEERRAADDYRSNRLQFITRSQRGLGGAKASRDQDTCEPDEQPAERVDSD